MGLRLYVSDGNTEICLGKLYGYHDSCYLAAHYLADINFDFLNDTFECYNSSDPNEDNSFELFFSCIIATQKYRLTASEFKHFFMLYAHDCAYDAGFKPECPTDFLESDSEKLVDWW